MPRNIFKIYDGRNYFWQWDTNQKLIVLDDTVDEVHFSNKGMTHSISKDVFTDKDGKRVCYIPDALLTLPKNLIAAAIVTDNNATKTLKQVKFAVQKRSIPSDYVVSDDVQSEDITDRLNIIEEIVEDMRLNLPNTYDAKGSAEQALADAKLYMAENYDKIGSAESVMYNLVEEIARAKNEEAAITRALHQINDRVAGTQSDVGALEKFVGVLPNGAEASTIVDYIDKKTNGVASDESIRNLDNRITSVEESIDTKIAEAVAKTMDNPDEALNSINELVDWVKNNSAKSKIVTVTLFANSWVGDTSPFSQVVTVNGVTENSKVDLLPTAAQIVELQDDEISLMTENNDGVITVWAIGDKPATDMEIQALITEVTTA